MCVFNFFIRKSWLAGEGDYLLRTRKLKPGFCGCSDTRRAFSRACIAKFAYHKPPLRDGWAALPLCPCGFATRRRPSRRWPQGAWNNRIWRGSAGDKVACGRPGPKAKKTGSCTRTCISSLLSALSFQRKLRVCASRMPAARFVRGPSAFPRSSSRPECARFCQSKLASRGPRSSWRALRAD